MKKVQERKMSKSEAGHRGGEATKARHPGQFSKMGQAGGATTLERYGRGFYKEIASRVDHKAVAEVITERDPDFYKKIGHEGGLARQNKARS